MKITAFTLERIVPHYINVLSTLALGLSNFILTTSLPSL
jgi:hypothetical protein